MAEEGDREHGLLELETRRRIYQRVRRVPGIHFRKLQRDLDLAIGTLEYNLHQMESAGLLVTREEGRYKAFFTNEDLDRRDRDYLYYLRQETPRRIAMVVADRPGIRFQELVDDLGLYKSRVSTVLKRLVKAGILEEERVGRQKAYRPVEAARIKRLIVQYRASYVDAMVDRFAGTWLDV
jgi:predicted transcriptional regulator